MNLFWYDWAGYAGVALVLFAFALMQAFKLNGNGLVYQLMNVLGALGLLCSMCFDQAPVNGSVLVLQVAWLLIGIFGIAQAQRRRRQLRAYARTAPPL